MFKRDASFVPYRKRLFIRAQYRRPVSGQRECQLTEHAAGVGNQSTRQADPAGGKHAQHGPGRHAAQPRQTLGEKTLRVRAC